MNVAKINLEKFSDLLSLDLSKKIKLNTSEFAAI